MDNKKTTLNATLKSFNSNVKDNPNQLVGDFVVHDFNLSWNGQIITKEICEENMQSLVGQYICCKYISKEENNGEDALGDHEVDVEINRDTGTEMMCTNTVPIGHITDVWINEDEEFCCRATLWLNKFYNTLSFLEEMIEYGINIPCSVEYAYSNYEVKDDVQYVNSPIYYEALCILNPIDRGEQKKVLPAYDCSKFNGFSFNSAITKDIDNEKDSKNERKEHDKVEENIFLKSLNGLSLGDTRDKLMSALAKTLSAEEFNNAWISQYNIFSDYVVYETYCDNTWKTFRIDYTVENDEIVLNADSKREVMLKQEYVDLNSASADEPQIADGVSLNSAGDVDVTDVTIETVDTDVENADVSLNDANVDPQADADTNVDVLANKEEILALNTQIAELQAQVNELLPYKEELEKKAQEEAFNSIKAEYEVKFNSLNAKEKFESEEVQALLKDVLDEEKSVNARLGLADMLLKLSEEMINKGTKSTKVGIELCAKETKNLVPTSNKGVFCGIDLS